ncbi:hypothetical protein [Mitsuaria sp. 7]|uniref:hypothetical protein n=1 Tax=Mitsuaria sp. 7 TaxID=1658665 RepID=UPI0012F9C8AC|nr:hypothetical protein [Mitsuaria sp. 7]
MTTTLIAIDGKLNVANLVGTIVFALLSLGIAALVLLAFLTVSSQLHRVFASNRTALSLTLLALWCLFAALLALACLMVHDFLSSVRFVQTP